MLYGYLINKQNYEVANIFKLKRRAPGLKVVPFDCIYRTVAVPLTTRIIINFPKMHARLCRNLIRQMKYAWKNYQRLSASSKETEKWFSRHFVPRAESFAF